MNRLKEFTKGFIKENPTYVQVLGMCPTLAVTTSAINGLGMGLATTAVLTMSNVVISLIRKLVPEKIRIPIFIVVIASFVTMIDLLSTVSPTNCGKRWGFSSRSSSSTV